VDDRGEREKIFTARKATLSLPFSRRGIEFTPRTGCYRGNGWILIRREIASGEPGQVSLCSDQLGRGLEHRLEGDQKDSGRYGPAAITAITSSHHCWETSATSEAPSVDSSISWDSRICLTTRTAGKGGTGIDSCIRVLLETGCPEQYDLLEDAMKNCEHFVFWSCDPDSTRAGMRAGIRDLAHVAQRTGQENGLHRSLLQLYGGPHADKWIAPGRERTPHWRSHRLCVA